MSISRTIQVTFEHRVYFTENVFSPSNPLLRELMGPTAPDDGKLGRALVILDESLVCSHRGLVQSIQDYFSANSDLLHLASPPVVICGGEQAKNSWANVSDIHALVERHHLDRHSYIIAAGGGAVLDAVGFAAATVHRGLRHIRIPSTTLAQNDSGVGVKNGINAFGKKNFIGTFAPPFAVINDFQLLASLSDRDKRAGCAEAVKVALIRDLSFFEQLEKHAPCLARFELQSMKEMIRRCAELHIDHITGCGDPFEFGSARPLDFGHWAAHKLEQLSGYRIRHGEAVAIGIAVDTLYSRSIGWLDSSSAERVLKLLQELGFQLWAPELTQRGADNELRVMQGLQEFREHLGGELTITLLQGIGRGAEAHEINVRQMAAAIEELEKRSLRHSHGCLIRL